MENIVYRILDTDSALATKWHKLEFYTCQTNEVSPYRKILELGIVVVDNKKLQIDFSLDANELDSLIKHLIQFQEYMDEFNKNSKPENV